MKKKVQKKPSKTSEPQGTREKKVLSNSGAKRLGRPTKVDERKFLSYPRRFAIFMRDNFTCQYCGAKSPDVALEIDHAVSRADGGDEENKNLVTACIRCNRGKSDNSVAIDLPDINFRDTTRAVRALQNQQAAIKVLIDIDDDELTLEAIRITIENNVPKHRRIEYFFNCLTNLNLVTYGKPKAFDIEDYSNTERNTAFSSEE